MYEFIYLASSLETDVKSGAENPTFITTAQEESKIKGFSSEVYTYEQLKAATERLSVLLEEIPEDLKEVLSRFYLQYDKQIKIIDAITSPNSYTLELEKSKLRQLFEELDNSISNWASRNPKLMKVAVSEQLEKHIGDETKARLGAELLVLKLWEAIVVPVQAEIAKLNQEKDLASIAELSAQIEAQVAWLIIENSKLHVSSKIKSLSKEPNFPSFFKSVEEAQAEVGLHFTQAIKKRFGENTLSQKLDTLPKSVIEAIDQRICLIDKELFEISNPILSHIIHTALLSQCTPVLDRENIVFFTLYKGWKNWFEIWKDFLFQIPAETINKENLDTVAEQKNIIFKFFTAISTPVNYYLPNLLKNSNELLDKNTKKLEGKSANLDVSTLNTPKGIKKSNFDEDSTDCPQLMDTTWRLNTFYDEVVNVNPNFIALNASSFTKENQQPQSESKLYDEGEVYNKLKIATLRLYVFDEEIPPGLKQNLYDFYENYLKQVDIIDNSNFNKQELEAEKDKLQQLMKGLNDNLSEWESHNPQLTEIVLDNKLEEQINQEVFARVNIQILIWDIWELVGEPVKTELTVGLDPVKDKVAIEKIRAQVNVALADQTISNSREQVKNMFKNLSQEYEVPSFLKTTEQVEEEVARGVTQVIKGYFNEDFKFVKRENIPNNIYEAIDRQVYFSNKKIMERAKKVFPQIVNTAISSQDTPVLGKNVAFVYISKVWKEWFEEWKRMRKSEHLKQKNPENSIEMSK